MSKFKLVPVTKAGMLGACSFFAIAAFSSGAAWGQSSEYDIDAQPLEQALAEFVQQEGLFLLNDINLDGLRSARVVGAFNRDEALELLLVGTGLSYKLGDNGVLVIFSANDQVDGALIPTQIERRGDDGEIDEEYLDLETVIVTGTNIRGVNNPTTPVLQFNREDIDLSGAVTVEDFLRTIPQNFNSETQLTADSLNPNDSGRNQVQGTSIDLRGLGAGSTLTLLNGRRMTATGSGNFVDISILPLGAIERVDVLLDGASAIYGSDAVGGAVNFITRRDFEGFDINARYGTVTDGSREDFGVGGAGGVNWGSGGAFIGVDYLDQTPLLSSERDFIDQAVVREGATFGSSAERFSVAGSFNQTILPPLSLAIDVLYSDRSSEASQNLRGADLDPRTVRADQTALFVNSRLEYSFSQKITGSLFFDYGRNQAETSDSDDDFNQVSNRNNDLIVIEGQLSGDLFDVPSGSISFALGGLYRKEEFEQFIADLDTPFNIETDRNITAFYGEALIPIIGGEKALPFMQRLELSIAGRYEDYSDFGDTFDPKIGLSWEINDQLALRGSYSESFRAPDLESLGRQEAYIFFSLPTFFFTSVQPPEPDNRLAFPNSVLALVPVGGNPNLGPERAETWSAGFSYMPSFLEGFSLIGNYYNISYTDRLEGISFLDPIQIPEFVSLVDIPPNLSELEEIFARADAGLADLNREPNPGQPFFIQPEDVQVLLRTGFQNVAERKVSGVDVNLQYQTETRLGRFSGGLNMSSMIDFIGRISDVADSVEQLNILFRPIDLNLRGNISWSRDGFTAFAAVNYADSYRDKIDETIANQIDSWTTVDLSFSYNTGERLSNVLLDNTTVNLSFQNLLDEDPPFVPTSGGLNFDSANADPFGRSINFTIAKRF